MPVRGRILKMYAVRGLQTTDSIHLHTSRRLLYSVMRLGYNQERHKNLTAYGFLLAAQVILLLVPPLANDLAQEWILTLCVSAVIFTSIFIVTMSKKDLVLGVFLGIVCLLGWWVERHLWFLGFTISTLIIAFVFFSFVGIKLAQKVGAKGEVDLNTVIAAVAGYIFVGIIGGLIVELVYILLPDSYSFESSGEATRFMYFAFITMTTVGFGDYIPVSSFGRAVASLLAVVGQIYLAVIVGLIIGRYLSKSK